ncbi:YetF domain-containing protein [Calidifontibacillus erzurumensis]|uniref:DUF421 domain-containing protein n=1 Tax=Calidifontibacillus erzurumensis TaxID=2741433 RepID=A0A8J8GCQ9_9BACI|nr:DUF421 domain-containing protein [Calidifontibacillus erzurumensis]NSL51424.1 DUF421 domain-containing protein [Calidifontibacillus erzurumensis]
MGYLYTGIELVIGFIALFVLTKMLGKTQITQITTFDFISALVLGELVGNALYDDKTHFGKILFSIFLWGMLIYIIEFITQKFKSTRKLLEGEPTIIIRKGKIDRQAMKKSKLDINQLQHLLRAKDVFSIQDVEYAILETDGKVSVLKKSDAASLTRKDMKLPPEETSIPITIIIDGELLKDNLKQTGHNSQWLEKQLHAHGISKIKDVLYAEYKEGEPLYVQKF